MKITENSLILDISFTFFRFVLMSKVFPPGSHKKQNIGLPNINQKKKSKFIYLLNVSRRGVCTVWGSRELKFKIQLYICTFNGLLCKSHFDIFGHVCLHINTYQTLLLKCLVVKLYEKRKLIQQFNCFRLKLLLNLKYNSLWVLFIAKYCTTFVNLLLKSL